jgi:2-oxoglutarate ferredoxin oxidoreductase subunit gamma
MMGFMTAVTKLLDPQAMRKAVTASVPKGTEELNLRAFDRGYEYGVRLTGGDARLGLSTEVDARLA